MLGLMQDWPLTVDRIIDHARNWHGEREVVTRSVEGPVVRTTYAEIHARAKRVSAVLKDWDVNVGDRIGTLAWNTGRHIEAWYGIMGIGAVCHTLNPRLFPEQLAYIINHAEDRIIFVDLTFIPLLEAVLPHCPTVERVVVMTDELHMPATKLPGAECYEALLSGASGDVQWGGFDEQTACGLCYTSGTTGNPKGVLYSHRSNFIHTLLGLQTTVLGATPKEVILPVVPMFHANAWGIAFGGPAAGSKLVMPGAKMDGESIYELLESEGVTFSAAVPTVWQGLLAYVREKELKFSTLKRVLIGGSAVPESLIRAFHDGYGIEVVQGWGMTETSPIGTLSNLPPELEALPYDEQMKWRIKQGVPPLGVELKLKNYAGQEMPHDGHTYGRLMARADDRGLLFQGRGRRHPRPRGLLRHRRRGDDRRARLHADHRPRQGCDQVGRRVDQLDRDREHRRRPSQGRARRRHRRGSPQVGRAAGAGPQAQARRGAGQAGAPRLPAGQDRQMVDAGRCGLRRRHPAGGHRQDRQEGRA